MMMHACCKMLASCNMSQLRKWGSTNVVSKLQTHQGRWNLLLPLRWKLWPNHLIMQQWLFPLQLLIPINIHKRQHKRRGGGFTGDRGESSSQVGCGKLWGNFYQQRRLWRMGPLITHCQQRQWRLQEMQHLLFIGMFLPFFCYICGRFHNDDFLCSCKCLGGFLRLS